MNTITEAPERTQRNRTIEFAWKIGTRVRTGYRPEEAEVDVYAILSCTHHGKADFYGQDEKCYRATLSREERRDGMRSFTIGGPHFVRPVGISKMHTERYSAVKLSAFADEALRTLDLWRDAGNEEIEALFTVAVAV